MVLYNQLFKIAAVQDQELILDFDNKQSLSAFEVNELFSFIVLSFEYKSVHMKQGTQVPQYLERVGFFSAISKIKHIEIPKGLRVLVRQEELFDLQTFTYKPEFYGRYETILAVLKQIGLSDDMSMLVGSSLGEIVDNAFSHNIGQWSSDIGPLVTALMQNNVRKRELTVSICDFGVGFLHTLRHNFPETATEAEAIRLALRANITGRPNQRGGNGLLFLQKNIFNGFKGTLSIRSTNTFVTVTDFNKCEIITEKLPFSRGVNIYFSVQY